MSIGGPLANNYVVVNKMNELLKDADADLIAEVLSHVLLGSPLPVDVYMQLTNLGIDPIKLEHEFNQY